jgi:hypothetical protein
VIGLSHVFVTVTDCDDAGNLCSRLRLDACRRFAWTVRSPHAGHSRILWAQILIHVKTIVKANNPHASVAVGRNSHSDNFHFAPRRRDDWGCVSRSCTGRKHKETGVRVARCVYLVGSKAKINILRLITGTHGVTALC